MRDIINYLIYKLIPLKLIFLAIALIYILNINILAQNENINT